VGEGNNQIAAQTSSAVVLTANLLVRLLTGILLSGQKQFQSELDPSKGGRGAKTAVLNHRFTPPMMLIGPVFHGDQFEFLRLQA
jgi:hypothetical protein